MPEDRVQVPSRRKDGTADQSDGYEIIGDADAAKTAIAQQLAQNATAEAGAARAAEQAAENAGTPALSAEEQARKDEIDGIVAQADADAQAEVDARIAAPPAPATTSRRRKATETTAER